MPACTRLTAARRGPQGRPDLRDGGSERFGFDVENRIVESGASEILEILAVGAGTDRQPHCRCERSRDGAHQFLAWDDRAHEGLQPFENIIPLAPALPSELCLQVLIFVLDPPPWRGTVPSRRRGSQSPAGHETGLPMRSRAEAAVPPPRPSRRKSPAWRDPADDNGLPRHRHIRHADADSIRLRCNPPRRLPSLRRRRL